jgi:branched-subunit amino acid ABC-type transport system permease component
VAGAAIGLAGCGPETDSDQVRICRMALPALHAPGATFEIGRVSPGTTADTVRIVYRVQELGQPARTRFIACRYAGSGLSPGRQDLVAVTTEAGPLGEAALFFLRRFWLATPEAAMLDPGDRPAQAMAPEVPFWTAYALQQTVSGLPQACVYGLLAAAYSLVYGLIGRIVFGFGEVAALAGYATLLAIGLVLAGQAPLLAAVLLALPVAVACGAIHGAVSGRLVVAPLAARGGLPILIATTGLMLVLSEYMRLAQGPALRWVPPFMNRPWVLARSGSFVVTATPVAMLATSFCLAAGLALLLLLWRSPFGRAWRAFADDPAMASLLGIDASRLFAATFALSAALAGLAGFVVTVHFGGVGYGSGLTVGLKALVAAVLGGIGSVPGALLGGLLLGLAEALWSAAMPIDSRDVAVYALLSLVLALRPGGLFGFQDSTPRRV